MRLVLFYDNESGKWKCLEDMCAHRFAPLSEGRIISGVKFDNQTKKESDTTGSKCSGKTCIQCAYHGWEFDVAGSCTNIPQQEHNIASNEKKSFPSLVKSFEVKSDVGIVWVWADPNTNAFSKVVPLPISPLLRRWHDQYGDGCAFMRDLPYGIELLGENLADLSHLPFSHHSLGSLKRDLGGPLPLRMLSESEKKKEAESWEAEYTKWAVTDAPILPKFQVEVVNASSHDPIFLGRPNVPETSSCTIGFYEPCHIRYRRNITGQGAIHVELFTIPTKAGYSRVILFNAVEAILP